MKQKIEKDVFQINEELRVVRKDEFNLMLEERVFIEGGKSNNLNDGISIERYEWKFVGFYSTLEGALNRAVDFTVSNNLHKVYEVLSTIRQEIKDLFKVEL